MIEKITKTVNRCTCEYPDCVDPETGQAWCWDSETEEIPKKCSRCKRRKWNVRQDQRRSSPRFKWVRTRQCVVCGGTQWITEPGGSEICAGCGRPL